MLVVFSVSCESRRRTVTMPSSEESELAEVSPLTAEA